jgi:hypothetical protein
MEDPGDGTEVFVHAGEEFVGGGGVGGVGPEDDDVGEHEGEWMVVNGW